MAWLVALLALIAVGVMPALASPQINPNEPIDMELKNADLVQVLRSFAVIGGAEPRIAAGISGKVTVKLDATPWSAALDSLCLEHRLECLWIQGDPPTLRIRPAVDGYAGFPENISLALRKADRGQVLMSFEAITDGGVALEGEFEGGVSLESRNVPWTLALLQVCADGGCVVDFSRRPVLVSATTGGELRAVTLPSGPPEAAIRAALAAPSLRELEAELVVEGELPAHVEAMRQAGNWVNALDRFCEVNRCRWFLEYGEPSVLRVVVRDPRIDQPIDFYGGFTAAELIERLASAIELEPELSELADRGTRIELEPGTTFEGAADALATAVGGEWRAEKGKLLVQVPNRPAGARRQATRARLGFDYAGEHGSVAASVELDWSRSVHRQLLAGAHSGGEAWLTLSWIPFGPDHQVVLPSVQLCPESGKRRAAAVGPVLTLHADQSIEAQEGASRLVAERLWDEGGEVGAAQSPRVPCLRNDLRLVLLARSEATDRAFNQVLLGERIGQYFMIAPTKTRSKPGQSKVAPGSSSAIVLTGQDGDGRMELAHIRPGVDGGPPTIDTFALKAGERTTLEVRVDSRTWMLDIRAETR